MKRAVFVLCLFYFSLFSFGQGRLFDRNVEWNALSRINKVLALPNGNWLTGGDAADCYFSWLSCLSSSGNELWNAGQTLGTITDIEVASNNRIYTAGDELGQDDVPADDGAFVLIYDINGRLLNWHVFINDSFSFLGTPDTAYINHTTINNFWATQSHNQIALIDTDRILVASDTFLVEIDVTSWSTLWTKSYKGHINDMILDANFIYLATDSGLIQTDMSGTILRTGYSAMGIFDSYRSPTGQIYFGSNDSVFAINSLLDITFSYPLHQRLSIWKGLSGVHGNVYITGKSVSDTSFVVVALNDSLIYQGQFPLQAQCILPSDIAMSGTTMLVANTYYDSIKFPLANYAFCKSTCRSYDLNGSSHISHSMMYFVKDSVTNVEPVLVDSIYINPNLTIHLYDVTTTVNLSLQNTGQDTIHKFSIQSSVMSNINCGYVYYFLDTLQINLFPNEILTMSGIKYYRYRSADTTASQTEFYVHSINGARPSSDCILPSIKTDISNTFLYPSPIHIYPNPTSNILNIETGSEAPNNTQLYISDITGRVLMQKTLTQSTAQIDIGAFATGLYIYTIKDGTHNPVSGKIEKTNH